MTHLNGKTLLDVDLAKVKNPNDFERYFVECANEGDVEGVVALYDSQATISDGESIVAVG